MKKDSIKDVLYFVQDAYGYLCCTDEIGFNACLDLWISNDCKYEIYKEVKNNVLHIVLFRL